MATVKKPCMGANTSVVAPLPPLAAPDARVSAVTCQDSTMLFLTVSTCGAFPPSHQPWSGHGKLQTQLRVAPLLKSLQYSLQLMDCLFQTTLIKPCVLGFPQGFARRGHLEQARDAGDRARAGPDGVVGAQVAALVDDGEVLHVPAVVGGRVEVVRPAPLRPAQQVRVQRVVEHVDVVGRLPRTALVPLGPQVGDSSPA